MDTDRFLTNSLRDPRILHILIAALTAVQPDRLVRKYLETSRLPRYERLFLLGIGKASEPMTLAAADFLDNFAKALIITKHGFHEQTDRIAITEAGHPVPDERSLAAGSAAPDFVSSLREDDLLICLISGGGSSLVTAPRPGISLADLQQLTTSLLASGATIDNINLIRGQLDFLKAGGLARATKATVISLILSDVVGDHLGVIASGLTVQSPLTNADALSVLDKFKITPNHNLSSLLSTPRIMDATIFRRVQNVIIGNNGMAVEAAKEQAKRAGFQTGFLDAKVQGEACIVGQQFAERLAMAAASRTRPFCLIGGGETTVTLHGKGKGGRNQELALAAVHVLDGLHDVLLISFATDGDDGPTDAAGAVVTGETLARAARLGMSPADYLARNDSYAFFASLGDLLKPGYTGTNVNDLIFLIGL